MAIEASLPVPDSNVPITETLLQSFGQYHHGVQRTVQDLTSDADIYRNFRNASISYISEFSVDSLPYQEFIMFPIQVHPFYSSFWLKLERHADASHNRRSLVISTSVSTAVYEDLDIFTFADSEGKLRPEGARESSILSFQGSNRPTLAVILELCRLISNNAARQRALAADNRSLLSRTIFGLLARQYPDCKVQNLGTAKGRFSRYNPFGHGQEEAQKHLENELLLSMARFAETEQAATHTARFPPFYQELMSVNLVITYLFSLVDAAEDARTLFTTYWLFVESPEQLWSSLQRMHTSENPDDERSARIETFVQAWVEHDFQSMHRPLLTFLSGTEESIQWLRPSVQDHVLRRIYEASTGPAHGFPISWELGSPSNIKPLSFAELWDRPAEVAQLFSSMQARWFYSVFPEDYLKAVYPPPVDESFDECLVALNPKSLLISAWVKCSILMPEFSKDKTQRVKTCNFLLKLAQFLFLAKDFASLGAVWHGLQSKPVKLVLEADGVLEKNKLTKKLAQESRHSYTVVEEVFKALSTVLIDALREDYPSWEFPSEGRGYSPKLPIIGLHAQLVTITRRKRPPFITRGTTRYAKFENSAIYSRHIARLLELRTRAPDLFVVPRASDFAQRLKQSLDYASRSEVQNGYLYHARRICQQKDYASSRAASRMRT